MQSVQRIYSDFPSLTIANHIFCTHKTAHFPKACKLTNLDYNSDPTFISCQSHNHRMYQEWDIREFLAMFISSSQNHVIPFRWRVLTCWKSFLPVTGTSIWRIHFLQFVSRRPSSSQPKHGLSSSVNANCRVRGLRFIKTITLGVRALFYHGEW